MRKWCLHMMWRDLNREEYCRRLETEEYKEKVFAYDMACSKQGRILLTFGD
jgi:hypothetical protein